VVGHLGLTPQSVHARGGFRVQGRESAAADILREDARILQEAGAFCLVLEMVPAPLAAEITAALHIPTIGIGAGPRCNGQVLVCNDLLGFNMAFKPRFVRRFAELESPIISAVESYVTAVRDGSFPTRDHAFGPARSNQKIRKLY